VIVCFADETTAELSDAVACEIAGRDAIFRNSDGGEVARFGRLSVLLYGGDKLRAVIAAAWQPGMQKSSRASDAARAGAAPARRSRRRSATGRQSAMRESPAAQPRPG
jgi:hypothetical protein